MTAKKSRMKLLLTERALRDLAEIEAYSVGQWGEGTAAKYLADIEAALVRLQEKPELLRPEEGFHPQLMFYRVNKHLLICDLQPHAIFLLTVMHASRDIPSRLAELEPSLSIEVQLLHDQLARTKNR